MKCWRCGAENEALDSYCTSCASPLADPRKGGTLALSRGNMTVRMLSVVAKALAKSLMLFALVIGLMIAALGLYDLVAGHRLLAGLGLTMTAVGCVLGIASALTLSKIPKGIVIVKHPMLSTVFTPMWNSMRFGSPRGEEDLSITLMMAGFGMFIVGLFLL